MTSLLLTICIFLACSLSVTSATDLATQVCRNTTDYDFCYNTLYSDPHTPTANKIMLAYIGVRQIAAYADNMMDSIVQAGLVKCKENYDQAIRKIDEAFGELDTDRYDIVDYWAVVDLSVHECENSLKGGWPLISKGNTDVLKLSNICFVISKILNQ